MNKTIVSISRYTPLRVVFRGLRFHKIYNKWLELFPRIRILPNSGITYRARRTEGVSLALEILEGGDCYDASLLPKDYCTFIDLGCNIGYFACWLAHHAQGRQIKGLMIDANPNVVAESRWHVQANKWQNVHVLQGVVGVGSQQLGEAEFYVHEADTISTSLVEIHLKHKNRYKKITAPIVSVSQEWHKNMGDIRCNVLKLDIEGCELVLLQHEVKFLELVDTIFVEWHKYKVSFDDLDSFLVAQGFRLKKIIEEIGDNGTAVYARAQELGPS